MDVMSSRRLLTLGVLALVTLVAGLWLAGRQASTPSGGPQAALYPALKEQLNSVTAIRIFTTGDNRAVELLRQDSGWTVSERAGYAADDGKVRKLLSGLTDARIYEEKTSKPENYASLGVEDIGAATAGSVRVELAGAAQPVNLLVGKHGPGAQSTYVRRAGEAQSWLINTSIDAQSSPADWLNTQILQVSADRVQSATVATKGAKRYTAAKNTREDVNFSVADLPKGKSLSSPAAANGTASALSSLTLSDVQPASTFGTATPDDHATVRTFDGLVVDLDGWTRDGKHFVRLKTAFDPAQAERFKIAPVTPAEAPKGEGAPEKVADGKAPQAEAATQAAAPDVEEEAGKAAARLDGWVYEIPDYKYQSLFKPLEQLL
jgi:uncharacterized protein DUF4340